MAIVSSWTVSWDLEKQYTSASETIFTTIESPAIGAYFVYNKILGGAGSDTITSNLSTLIPSYFSGPYGAQTVYNLRNVGAYLYGEDGNDTLIGDGRDDLLTAERVTTLWSIPKVAAIQLMAVSERII